MSRRPSEAATGVLIQLADHRPVQVHEWIASETRRGGTVTLNMCTMLIGAQMEAGRYLTRTEYVALATAFREVLARVVHARG